MKPLEAVEVAKQYIAGLFARENVINIGLEELRYRDGDDVWEVTIGFTRPWDSDRTDPAFKGPLTGWPPAYLRDGRPLPRIFKRVEVRDSDAKVLGLSDRPLAA